jgi:iron complex transport system permease protein
MPPALLWRDELARRLVLNLRLPRILTAFLMGMALSSAGAVLQMIFRNPLVSPGFLGVSQGAAFGAAFSIIFLGKQPMVIELAAAGCACLGLLSSYTLAQRIRYGDWVLRLVLAGIAVSALFSAGVGVLKYLADPMSELPEIVFWLLGGLWAVTWRDFLTILGPVAVCLGVLLLMRWRLNLLALPDETAFSLGAAPRRERGVVLVASVIATAAVVAVGGLVGWIGLIVPHVARRIVGVDAQRVLPASMLLGGVFALLCDDLARTVRAGEIPLSIITSLAGATVFVMMFATKALRARE